MLKVHDAPAASVAPDRLMVLVPATAVIVPLPQEPVKPLGVETFKPPGSGSLKARPVKESGLAAGLVKVKLSVVLAPVWSVAVPNDLLSVGGATTVMLAVAAKPVTPCVSVTVLVVLFWTPAAVPVTLVLKVHDAPAASVAPVKLILLVPAVAEIAPPPQEPVRPLGVETTKPEGSVSLKVSPVKALGLPAGLLKVKARVVLAPVWSVAVPNDLLSVG